MCTEHDENAVTVCDVAIDDVRTALACLSNVEITQVAYVGNRVVNEDPTQVREFRARLGGALARHGVQLDVLV